MLRVEARRSRRAGRRLIVLLTLLSAFVAPSVASAWTVHYNVYGHGALFSGPAPVCVSGPWTATGQLGKTCDVTYAPLVLSATVTAHPGSVLPFDGWILDKWTGDGVVLPGGMSYKVLAPILPLTSKTVNVYFKDVRAPVTTIVSAPFGTVGTHHALFTFRADENANYQCRLDYGPWLPCGTDIPAGHLVSKEYFGLHDGPHTFMVRAIDLSGNVGPMVGRTWTISHFGPLTDLTAYPSNPSNDATPQFTFVTAPGAFSYCSLDGGAYVPCTSPYTVLTPLADGVHTFAVHSAFWLSSVGPAATYEWVVDRTAPVISITGPAEGSSTDQTTQEFILLPSEALNASGLSYSLDGAAAVPCTSPLKLTGLSLGKHTLVVHGTDLAGNAASAARTWTVVAPTPLSTTQPAVTPTAPVTTTQPVTTTTPSVLAPVLNRLSLSTRRFHAAKSGGSIVSLARHVGTVITFRLSRDAIVTVTVYKSTGGLKGHFHYTGEAGKNVFRFSGRLNGRSLAPGVYRLFLKAGTGSLTGSPSDVYIRILR